MSSRPGFVNEEIGSQPIVFRNRPRPVPPTSDTAWRLGALVLVLSHFRGSAADAEDLSLVTHALRTPTTRARFLAWWDGRFVAGVGSFNLEPSLELTIRLAHAESLVSVSPKGRVTLLDKGKSFSESLKRDADIFSDEKSFLAYLVPISTAKLKRAIALIR
ncbi:hypothetical protein GT352_29160 [Streptomyces sp. SID1046]|uniref:hypothetical protein n=1 Tax=Streptomyces sp. SID1046 TaxID=2690249 RepID=UPI001369780B|nr:hypothetical protein [Streptomyces sp. SID1046]MYV77970.1 hypothetical protein [Streptomyces sp. SID1046]